jgi:PPK2 family polyphosphate:nucleotide phosphotransferase
MARRSKRSLLAPFVIRNGKGFRLSSIDPSDTRGLAPSKEEASELLEQNVRTLAEHQEKLYAQDRWALLLVFQAMDAAGKDSCIEHVFSGVNPQGCEVHSFKAPSPEELDHDFLWRTQVRLPERGRIGIFNRSHYEEVLVVRVHPELLKNEKLPDQRVTNNIWQARYDHINAWEQHLADNGYVIRKFFLHVTREEQRKRFLKRLEEPEKRWKFSMGDVKERQLWDDYMDAYERMVRATSAPHAPWVVVPANKKWFARWIVSTAIIEALEELNLRFPEVDREQQKELERVRRALIRER